MLLFGIDAGTTRYRTDRQVGSTVRRRPVIVSKPKDPSEVVDIIKESIEASLRKSRKVRFHNLRAKFGWQSWTVQRKELVAGLLKEQGILAQPR
jgi:hypothetical protein